MNRTTRPVRICRARQGVPSNLFRPNGLEDNCMPGLENAYALVAGIANYQNINPLPQTVLKDARDLYDLLIDPNYCGYLDQNVNLMLDDKATGAAFRAGLA